MTRDLIGQQLGNYRLDSKLGKGGFAQVYLGQHVRLSTQAAIKVLLADLSNEEIHKFQDEAKTIANLKHPHIVPVLDFDVFNGIPFLVMDYCPHGTLTQRHATGERVPLSMVISYVKQVADALQYAHDQKIIHRDVKPLNMLIGQRGNILLSDFGIASTAHSTHSMTIQNIAGSPAYMAPEQIQAQARPASDQYALAIVTYQWLAGEPPFIGKPDEIAIKHLMVEPPSLRQKLPNLSVSVEEVVFKALAKDPKDRFPTVQDFAIALEQASQTQPSRPVPLRPIRTLAPTVPAPPMVLAPIQAGIGLPVVQPLLLTTVAVGAGLPIAQVNAQPMVMLPMPNQSPLPRPAFWHRLKNFAYNVAPNYIVFLLQILLLLLLIFGWMVGIVCFRETELLGVKGGNLGITLILVGFPIMLVVIHKNRENQ